MRTKRARRGRPATFFEPGEDGVGGDAEDPADATEARALLVGGEDRVLVLLGVARAQLERAGGAAATAEKLLLAGGGLPITHQPLATTRSTQVGLRFRNHTAMIRGILYQSCPGHYRPRDRDPLLARGR